MNFKILDRYWDKVIRSAYITVKMDYEFALARLTPLIDKLDFQRNTLRASFYKRLERDILDGCVMPNITIALQENCDQWEKIEETYLQSAIAGGFILDGIQRLNTLKRISQAEKFDKNGILYANLLICESMDRLLYRMITLNNGQKPMSARHQIEILAGNIFDFDHLPLLSISEKQKPKHKGEEYMSREVLIKGYLAFISSSVNIDNQKIIEEKMNELIAEQIMESDLPKKDVEFEDVVNFISAAIVHPYMKEWFNVANNFIGFTAAMNRNFKAVACLAVDELAQSVELFEDVFKALDVSKIKLGMARRRMVKFYFEKYETLSKLSPNQLLDKISQEL